MTNMTSPLDRRRHLTGMAFITPTMAVIIAILVYPILQSIVLSFGQSSIDGSEPYSFVGLKHYATLAGNERFWNSLWVTLVFTGLSIPLELAMGIGLVLTAAVWAVARGCCLIARQRNPALETVKRYQTTPPSALRSRIPPN